MNKQNDTGGKLVAVRTVRGPVVALVLGIGGVLAGCASGDPTQLAGSEDVETLSESLFFPSSGLWENRVINVCFKDTGFDTEKTWVREILKGQRSWEDSGRIVFNGFGMCGANPTGVTIQFWTWADVTYDPAQPDLMQMRLEGGSSISCPTFSPPLTAENCFKRTVLHEFGHALFIDHEQERSDRPTDCLSARDGNESDTTWGPFDLTSIMLTPFTIGVCDSQEELSGIDRTGIARMYGTRDGATAKLGDYNADGRADLLCQYATSGRQIDFADMTGRYGTQDFSMSSSWCTHDTGKLFKGNFNNDPFTDILCHDVATGNLWIDYADGSGQFSVTDWSTSTGFCSQTGGQLLVGDFDADGQDDVLCHDVNIGFKSIDYASDSGQFAGNDYLATAGWCSEDTERLYVGNFNGIGGDDLLCHDILTGTKKIDYANSDGQFGGTNWSIGSNWCGHAGAELHIGDFNRDGRDDLLCHDTMNGSKWIDHASFSGAFNGTNWSSGANWCTGAARLYIGDANNDDRDDMICHHMRSGEKWIDYADTNGVFGGTDFYAAANWCKDDESILR